MFEEFKDCKRYTIEELRKNNYEQIKSLNSNLIYIVEIPDKFKVEFINDTTAHKLQQSGKNKGENALYNIKVLEDAYNSTDKKTLYIGKGCWKHNDGYKRLIMYLEYGIGVPKSHDGGRSIWQIKNNNKLNILFMPCKNPEFYEYQLIKFYKKENNNKKPVANKNSGNSKSNKFNCKGCPRYNECSANK